eukprot:6198706-Pleurochrysis_carterae.AAC.1
MEQRTAVQAAMEMRANARVEARRDISEQQSYFKHKREQASQTQSDKLAAEYTKAMAAFDTCSAPGRAAPTLAVARARLAKLSSAAAQHAFLREQLEMRVLVLGLTKHAISRSTGGQARLRAEGALLTEAVALRAKLKTHKQLGTPTVDAEELAEIEVLDLEKLKTAASEARSASDAPLDSDAVQDRQPSAPSALDASLVGAQARGEVALPPSLPWPR